MPKRVPTISVVVIREDNDTGKNRRVTPAINKSFFFTDDEVKAINKQHPGALRMPVNESTVEDTGHSSDDKQAGAESTSRTSPEGNKKPTAAKGTKAKAKASAIERDATGGGGTDAADAPGVDADEDEDI